MMNVKAWRSATQHLTKHSVFFAQSIITSYTVPTQNNSHFEPISQDKHHIWRCFVLHMVQTHIKKKIVRSASAYGNYIVSVFFVRYYDNYQNTINYLLLKTLTLTNLRTRVFRDIRDNLLMLPSIRTGKLSVNIRLFSYFTSISNSNYKRLINFKVFAYTRITYDLQSCFDDIIFFDPK